MKSRIIYIVLSLLFVSITLSGNTEFRVEVSSSLTENIGGKGYEYSGNNLFDGDLETCWVGSKFENGIGESIIITFPDATYVDQILLYNGFQKNKDSFYKNNRVNELEVILDDNEIRTFYLNDSNLAGVLRIDKKVTTIKLVIKDIYTGWKYSDTCISEIKFVTDEYKTYLHTTEKDNENIRKIRSIYLDSIYGRITNSDIDFLMDDYQKQSEYEDTEKYIFDEYRSILINDETIDSKYLYERLVKIDPLFSMIKSGSLLNKKSLIMEIADAIDLNDILSQPPMDEHLTGDFVLDRLFSEEEIVAFKKINGYEPVNVYDSWWYGNFEKYIFNDYSKTTNLMDLKDREFTNNESFKWKSYSSAYWETIHVNNPFNRKGKLELLINENFIIEYDLENLDHIYIGFNIKFIKFIIEFEDYSSHPITFDPVIGHNWVDP